MGIENMRSYFPDKSPKKYRDEKIKEAVDIRKTKGSNEALEFLNADFKFQVVKNLHKIQRTLPREMESDFKNFEGRDLVKEVLTTNVEKTYFDNLVLGISPFNPYFTADSYNALPKLIYYGLSKYKTVRFYIPDKPAIYSQVALGDSQEKAEQKTKNRVKDLVSKIREAGVKNGLSVEEVNKMIVDSEYLESNEIYNELHKKVIEFFNTDEKFANAVREASWTCYLQAKGKYPTMRDMPREELDIAAQYLLAETPLFFASKEILGTNDSIFAYHQLVDYQKKIYNKEFQNSKFDFVPSENQGYAVLNQFPEKSMD